MEPSVKFTIWATGTRFSFAPIIIQVFSDKYLKNHALPFIHELQH